MGLLLTGANVYIIEAPDPAVENAEPGPLTIGIGDIRPAEDEGEDPGIDMAIDVCWVIKFDDRLLRW